MRAAIGSIMAAAMIASSASVAMARPTASTCGFGGLDFSSLVGLDIAGSDGGSQYSYLLSVCGPLSSAAAASCLQISPQSAACQKQVSGGTGTFDIGNWIAQSPPVWSYIDPAAPSSGVQYTMVGAQSCWATGQPQAYAATVQLVCAAKQEPLTVSTKQGSCTQTYVLRTPLACSGPAPAPAAACGATLGGHAYDLSSLMGTDLVGTDGSSTYQYLAAVCGDLSSATAASCTSIVADASTCQIQVQPKGASYVTGEWPGSNTQVQWAYMDDANPALGVQYTLTGAQQCWAKGSAQDYETNVQFECAQTQSQGFTVTVPEGSCTQNYTIQTPHACAGTPPPPASKCGATLDGHTFDFSSLTGADISGSDGQSPPVYNYYLNVCGDLTSTSASECTQIMNQASACQQQISGGTGTYVLGAWMPTQQQWSWVDPANQQAGVQYTMTGAQSCWAHPPVQSYMTNVQFVCGNAPSPMAFKVSTQSGSCTSNLTITTPLACGKLSDNQEEMSMLF